MDKLRHLALSAGRGLALLAAMMLVLLPALPAHAHAHLSATMVAGHDHGQDEGRSHHHRAKLDPSAAADHDGSGSLPQQTGDCCFVCHVSVLPAAHAVPLPPSHLRSPLWGANGRAPPDALSERLPEPPRPFA